MPPTLCDFTPATHIHIYTYIFVYVNPHLLVFCYLIPTLPLFVAVTLAIINMPQFAYIRLLAWVFITCIVASVANTFPASF